MLYIPAPSLPPWNLSSTIITPSSMILTWCPPLSSGRNGIIQYYTITIIEVETGFGHTLTSNSTQLTLTSLRPFYNYQFQVAAVTVEEGPLSGTYSIQMPQDGINTIVHMYNAKFVKYMI